MRHYDIRCDNCGKKVRVKAAGKADANRILKTGDFGNWLASGFNHFCENCAKIRPIK